MVCSGIDLNLRLGSLEVRVGLGLFVWVVEAGCGGCAIEVFVGLI